MVDGRISLAALEGAAWSKDASLGSFRGACKQQVSVLGD